MCSSNSKNAKATPAADINGRPVLQPATSNQRFTRSSSLKKSLPLPKSTTIVPVPPPPPPPKQKQGGNNKADSMNSTTKTVIPEKKPKKSICINSSNTNPNSLVVKYLPEMIVNVPGSIAAAWKEQVEVMQVQRKMKIAHYGRSIKSAKYDSCKKITSLYGLKSAIDRSPVSNVTEEKRCSFITPYSDPIFVAYHDEEWGIPVHDDKLLFELLVLTAAQVGTDWTSVLKKRQLLREAFSEFEAETVSEFTDVKITTTGSSYGIDVGFIRGVVDNSKCILKIKKEFGSFEKYIWEFVNHKPIMTKYKVHHKMPVKTSKSEAISKDMLRRGFRQVGSTMIHSFMQAAGLTNDHLTTCSRHNVCAALVPCAPSPSSTSI
ncbi:putative DNA-3-methyladenine glycosylase I [Helianthus anomalus]